MKEKKQTGPILKINLTYHFGKGLCFLSILIVFTCTSFVLSQEELKTVETTVSSHCGMCQDRILQSAIEVDGVMEATYNLDTKLLSVQVLADFEEQDLHRQLADVGHDTEQLTANQDAYDALPACCKYRDPNLKPCGPEPSVLDVEDLPELISPGLSASVKGTIVEESAKGKLLGLPGVNVYWEGSTEGTSTDENGVFVLDRVEGSDQLIVSYVGFDNDTISMEEQSEFQLVLSNAVELNEVQVTHKKRSTSISYINPLKVQSLNEQELCKAACCNLSESFETNASVNASVTDAVTGTRQIEMLGLAGPYVQLTQENMPGVRGLAALYGMSFTPGPFIESIQINQGTGSVVNGFESMVGQINVELKKPSHKDKFYLNLFASQGGRMEANVIFAEQLTDKWSSSLLLHGREQPFKQDNNGDGFLDSTLGGEYVAINRHRYKFKKGWEGQLGVKAVQTDQVSGQEEFDRDKPFDGDHPWGAMIDNRRLEVWSKVGKLFAGEKKSIGFQVSGSIHDLDSNFGTRSYTGTQKTLYGNFLFQKVLDNPAHQFTTGLSLQLDDYEEQLVDQNFDRREVVPGAYAEYSFSDVDRFSAVLGMRLDHHNNYGLFYTPRVHLRFVLGKESVLRFVAGRGQRTASIISENIGVLASSRQVIIHSERDDTPYGLDPEVSWNVGLNLSQEILLGKKSLTLSADAYRTFFENQVVVDYDHHPQELNFYNLDGKSYSNSGQIQVDMELIPKLDMRLAYRLNDVKTNFGEELREKPLLARHRAFFNLAYETENDWQFDFTTSWQGQKRIPDLEGNPEAYQMDSRSPDFFDLHAQITKVWNDKFDWYLGAENLLNYRQPSPILSADLPYSPYFDASMIWGPVFGRMFYTGIRYRIEK